MKAAIKTGSSLWLFTFSLTGAGTAFLGSYLPSIAALWRLHDHQAGVLVACFFTGSFTGSMLLSRHLRLNLNVGSWLGCIGFLVFAQAARFASGFHAAACALAVVGFGLGQLMSSVNLLVGAAAGSERSKYLARLGAAWCAGAILSPVLTSIAIPGISPPSRLSLFALLFMIPFGATQGRDCAPVLMAECEPSVPSSGEVSSKRSLAALCIAIFLIYGGIEAGIASWIPMFAVRYSVTPLVAAQWLISVFWLGLMLGRIYVARVITPSTENLMLRVAIISACCCLALYVVAPSVGTIWAGGLLVGVCLSPIFPLMLSAAIASGLSVRALGAALAACGLGAAMFTAILGFASSLFSLRAAMLLPLLALGILLLLFWRLQQRNASDCLTAQFAIGDAASVENERIRALETLSKKRTDQ